MGLLKQFPRLPFFDWNSGWSSCLNGELNSDQFLAATYNALLINLACIALYLSSSNVDHLQVFNIVTETVVREIGKEETIRYMGVSICRAVPDIRDRFVVFIAKLIRHSVF